MDPRHDFTAHRCAEKPRGVSIRRLDRIMPWDFAIDGKSAWRWILGGYEIDGESGWEGLEPFGYIRFCPYCGKELEP